MCSFEFYRTAIILNEGRAINDFIGNALYGFDNKQYKSMMVGAAFDYSMRNNNLGLNSIETMSKYIRPNIIKTCGKINNVTSIAYGVYDTYQGYIEDGHHIGYHTTKTAANNISGFVGGFIAAKWGLIYGGIAGSSIAGVGALPGAVIGGITLGIAGSYGASSISDFTIDLMW